MKRKLVQQGISTLMISLPAKWVQEHNLHKGSEIDLNLAGQDILISSTSHQTIKSETTITLIDTTESSIRTLITNTYRNGYDRIIVLFENEKQFQILSHIIKTRLVGFDIIKKEKNRCIVENITEPSVDQFSNITKKIFFSISELFDVTIERCNKHSNSLSFSSDYKEIAERIQKYDNFCRRVLAKERSTNPKTELLWAFLMSINHGQRELFLMNQIIDQNITISEKTLHIIKGSKKLFELIKQSYFENNLNLLSQVHALEKELMYSKGYAQLQQTKGKENIILYHTLVSIRQFYLANSPLSGLLLP